MGIYIVFTNDDGRYYIEGTFISLDYVKNNFKVEKELDNRAFSNWTIVQSELNNPTIKTQKQLVIIDELINRI